jgi:hypothetical protein
MYLYGRAKRKVADKLAQALSEIPNGSFLTRRSSRPSSNGG